MMKNLKAIKLAITVAGILGASQADALGWQNEQVIETAGGNTYTTPSAVCSNMANEKVISCVYAKYTNPTNAQDIYERRSLDGGVTWPGTYLVTNNAGDDYGPYIYYDGIHNKQWLAYSRWHVGMGGAGNDLVLMSRNCTTCQWSTPQLIAGGDGQDYWIPSILVLHNGNILVFYTKNGPESRAVPAIGSGRLQLRISTNNGASWGAPITPTQTCDAEFPRAIQNQGGVILMMFSRYADIGNLQGGSPCVDWWSNGYPKSDIHTIWSTNGGASWVGESDFYRSSDSVMHPFIYPETTQPQTGMGQWHFMFVGNTGIYPDSWAAYDSISQDQGLTWLPPVKVSQSLDGLVGHYPFNIDPGFTEGCRGPMFFYSSGYDDQNGVNIGRNVYTRRYDALGTCSQ